MFLVRIALPLVVLVGCKNGDSAEDTQTQSAVNFVEIHPPVGGQGTTLELDLDATQSIFQFGNTSVDLGEGITIAGVDVDDGWGARAQLVIAPDAALGPRDVVVDVAGKAYQLPDGFEVIAQSFTMDPSAGKIGETMDVTLLGANTAWTGGVTWPSFGDGIEVHDFTVISETLAQASVSISTDAAPGWRDVVMDNGGGDLVTNYDGFKVDRVGLVATFDPAVAEQGDTVEFTIKARGTDFDEGDPPEITFFDKFGANPDVIVDDVSVLGPEDLFGQMTLSNAATLGMRDVRLDTAEEGLLISDAFEVVGGGWSLEEVAISLTFNVVRVRDYDTGAISEFVQSTCVFYIPLDPPCPTGGGSGSGSGNLGDPSPYDNNGVWGVTGSGEGSTDDCPYPTTLGAGDYVWLESEANTITLEKQYDTETGQIYYEAQNLVLADYVTDNWYDLHTQGEVDGIGEYLLEDVQPTVPADWEWIDPSLDASYTQSRSEDFVFSWTPAQTYPDAIFFVSLYTKQSLGPLAEDEWYGYAATLPWDDGEHLFTAGELSSFAPGIVPTHAYSYISGPEFGLPESIYQENVASSYIYLVQYMNLE